MKGNKMSRTENSIKNIMASLAGQVFAIIISFAARKVFLLFLSVDYLGINSVFSSVLTMLSLFEIGIGPAIVFSLYKPLEEKNSKSIKALMRLYKNAYQIVGFAVIGCGIALAPFIEIFVGTLPSIPHIHLIYILFVLNTGLSYFFAYKRSLIIADQKQYITVLYHYAVYVVLNALQILVLYLTQNYLLFLIMQIAATVLENALIARRADKMYPILSERNKEKIDPYTKNEIVQNVKAMILHRVGGIAVNATDNILISRLIGVTIVGIYSNYILIVSALNAILYQFFSSVSASIGNLGASTDGKESYRVFKNINFFNFWIVCFSAISLFYLINPVISTIWLGDESYTFSSWIVLLIALNFYVSGMRQTVLTFKESFGLNRYDWYKPILEALTNLFVSIILGKLMGLAGIFIGTLVTRIFVTLWIEPLVLFKNGFKMEVNLYYKKYFIYFFISGVLWLITGALISLFPLGGIMELLVRLLICLIVPNGLLLILFYKREEFKFLLNTVAGVLKHLRHRLSKVAS
jgi:O-antigen/teichoic acid export membrane protein